MSDGIKQNRFEIEKQIYNTQWTNIRHHWNQTFAGITLLSTLIVFAIIPIRFLCSDTIDSIIVSGTDTYIKWFVAVIIFLLGFVTFLNQLNHYMRSREARKVIVAIERNWGLYDDQNRFIFQDKDMKYDYSKFAGGEKRLSHSIVQFAYIVVITFTALVFVILA